MRGTASLVFGMTEETMFMNTVRDRRIVTPETDYRLKHMKFMQNSLNSPSVLLTESNTGETLKMANSSSS